MIGAAGRRTAVSEGRDPAAVLRFTVVALCLLGTALAYVACIVVVAGGHIDVLFGLIPWLATTALVTIVVVTAWAMIGSSHQRLTDRHRLTADRISELAAVIARLEPAERGRAKKQLVERLDLTLVALREVIERSPDVRGELVAGGLAARVERELAGAKRKWDRVSAVGILGLLGAESSIEPLRGALDDPDADVAYGAAQALSLYQNPAAYIALLSALKRERIPAPRVANMLESFRSPQARELIERWADSELPRVRYWVAYLLGSLADPQSRAVIERLAHDPDDDVRANAAESLANFPNEQLLDQLLRDDSWVVRSHAAKASGATGLGGLAPRLASLLEDRSWWVRQNATISLAALGEAATPCLLSQLHSNDRFARNKAAEALIRSGYAAKQIDRLAQQNPHDREAASTFLIDLGRAEALGTIETAARNACGDQVRDRLCAVLEAIGTDDAHRALEHLASR